MKNIRTGEIEVFTNYGICSVKEYRTFFVKGKMLFILISFFYQDIFKIFHPEIRQTRTALSVIRTSRRADILSND